MEIKGCQKQLKMCRKNKLVAGQSVVATHKQANYPVKKRLHRNKQKISIEIKGFQVPRSESPRKQVATNTKKQHTMYITDHRITKNGIGCQVRCVNCAELTGSVRNSLLRPKQSGAASLSWVA